MKKTITIPKVQTISIEHEIELPYFFYKDKPNNIWGLFEHHVVSIHKYGATPNVTFYKWDDFKDRILPPFDLAKLPEYEPADSFFFFRYLNTIQYDIEQIGAEANAAKGTQNTNINLREG